MGFKCAHNKAMRHIAKEKEGEVHELFGEKTKQLTEYKR